MKEMLNVKNSEIYAEMYISSIPKNAERIMMYGVSDKRTMEIILDSLQKAFPKATFVVADREANTRLLSHFYKGKKFTYINTTDDEKDLALFEEGEIGKMPKFDAAITNPPYDRGLHLKILNKIKNISEIILNISPIQKYQEYILFNDFKNEDLKELASTHKIEFIKYLTCDDACSFFGLKSLGSDVGVWKITKGKVNNIENNLKKIIPNYNLVKKIYSKIKNFDRLDEYLSDSAEKYSIKFVYGLTLKNHGGHGFSAFSCTSRIQDTAFENNGKSSHVRYVNATNQKNRENIWKVYTSKFMRFYFKQVILGFPNYHLIPWFDSFDMNNINKELCDIFNVTGYIDDEHAEPGSEWEIILNVMKEHK